MKRKNRPSLLKKIVKTLPVLSLLVAVTYAGVAIKDVEIPVLLPVTDIQVNGSLDFLNKADIESIVKNNTSGGYFTVDLNTLRELLVQQPWVKTVTLRRKWPASLDVYIVEQSPIAFWNDDGYINKDGQVFKPEKIDVALDIPNLSGPDGHHNDVWKFMNVLYQEMALLEYDVVRLDLDERRAWQLVVTANSEANQETVANMINIRLGRFDTEKRLQRFVRILPALIDEDGKVRELHRGINSDGHKDAGIEVIDMRYPNGFAVQIKEA